MKELVISFDAPQLIKIRDWSLDEIGEDDNCKEAVNRARIDENGGVLDERGRERLLLGITALNVLFNTGDIELLECREYRKLNGVSVFRLDYSDDDMYFEFNFLQ